MTNKLDTLQKRSNRILKLLSELSDIGEMSIDTNAHEQGINWHAIGLTLATVTSNPKNLIRVSYAGLEDWNQKALCALLDFIFPTLHTRLDSESQEHMDDLYMIRALINSRDEIKVMDSQGQIHNRILHVEILDVDTPNNSFIYVRKPSSSFHSSACELCKAEKAHTDKSHAESVHRTILQSTAPAMDFEDIQLKASRYEWVCPNCQNLNNVIEVLTRVQCSQCDLVFSTGGADHAEQ